MIDMTKEEKAWVKKVQKLLNDCPPRFGFYTIGDPDLGIYDITKEHKFDENVDMVIELDRYNAFLGDLKFPRSVHGVCG